MKVAVSASLLIFLFWKLDFHGMLVEIRAIGSGALLLILLLVAVQVVVSTLRWQRVLRYLDRSEPLRTLMSDLLVGRALNLVLPTQVGGDVARGLRSARRVGSEIAWSTILFERMLGLLVLAAIPAFGLLLWPRELPVALNIAVAGVALGLALAMFYAHSLLELAGRLSRPLPALERVLTRLAGSFRGGLRSWRAHLETAGWSAGVHALNLSMMFVAGAAWAEPGLGGAIVVGVPLVLIASMIPISVGGLGLRESLFVAVLTLLGVSAEHALALSVVWLAALVPPALAGLAVLATERALGDAPPGNAL